MLEYLFQKFLYYAKEQTISFILFLIVFALLGWAFCLIKEIRYWREKYFNGLETHWEETEKLQEKEEADGN